MAWIITIGLATALVAAGFYLLLGVAIIVTALVERRPLRFLDPAEPGDPEWRRLDGAMESVVGSSPLPNSNPYATPRTTPYMERQIQGASTLGFSKPLLLRYFKGKIYRTYNVLMVSPSRETLAVVRWGTTASIRNEVTSLYSALNDGRYLVTSDRPTGSRAPGLYDDHVFLRAAFAQLVDRHEARLRAAGDNIRHFTAENPLDEYEAILDRRALFLVEAGDAYWLDSERTAFRSTLKGALKLYLQTFSTKHVDQSLVASAP
jgi:hypothetical protein